MRQGIFHHIQAIGFEPDDDDGSDTLVWVACEVCVLKGNARYRCYDCKEYLKINT